LQHGTFALVTRTGARLADLEAHMRAVAGEFDVAR